MPLWTNDTRKHAAKSLFGRALRVALADWVADRDGETFYLQEAQLALASTGEAPSAVAAELRRFVEFDLLTETRLGGRVYFTATDSSYWKAFEAISEALRVETELRTARDPSVM